ncbi:YmfQ family protein [Bacillus sp. NPDC077027]|uniref:YmfQ family protein n=1 Tax=Bacillus sp. NPDC077027 TaxID=3390548 RepID=UPI003CFF688E
MSKYEEMKAYLPGYLTELKEFDDLVRAETLEFESLEESIFEITDQLFPLTATWGLNRWERLLKVQRESGESYETRRAHILNLMSNIPPITYLSLEKAVNRFLKNPSAVIRQTPGRYHFSLRVNMEDLQNTRYIIDTLETLKPAHLAYQFTSMHHTDIAQIKDYQNRLLLRSRVGFFDHIPIYLNGDFLLNGTFYLSGIRGTSDIPLRFKQSLTMLIKAEKDQQIQSRTRYTMTASRQKVEQRTSIVIRLSLGSIEKTKKKMTIRIQSHVQNQQGGSLLIKQNYWTLDGTVPLEGSKYLAATAKKITL